MKYYKLFILPLFLATFTIKLLSCATITVNVYFPAEEVRDAYISLEEELLKPQDGGDTGTDEVPGTTESVAEPQSLRTYPKEPLLKYKKFITIWRGISLDFSEFAWAQDNIAREITNKIKKMPEVVKAFQSRGKRLSEINESLSERKVGEGNKGLLVKRGSLSSQETKVFNAENQDRKIIVDGMARAIVEINGLEPTPQNINRVAPEAAKQFAAVRRREAKSGWQVQLPDGKWAAKK